MTGASERLVVVSPGSRSTPLVLALAAQPSLTLVDVIDERAAAFFALGHARATGRAAIVLATSGTAPAHWYPAILEAEAAGLPLVLVSANRPTALSACGAPQTIDQHGLFGGHVRFFADLGDPRSDAAWLRHVERTVRRALAASDEGPVHLDVRLEKPLEPSTPADATDLCASAVAHALAETAGPTVTRGTSAPPDVERLARRLAQAEAPLVLAGPLPAWADVTPIRALADVLGAPLAAEWASQLRTREVVTTLDLWLGSPAMPPIDLVIQLGATPTPSTYEAWARSAGRPLPRVVIGRSVADPSGTAEEIVLGDPSAVARALASHLPPRPPSPHRVELGRLDRLARAAIDEVLAEPGLSEGAAVRAALRRLPAGAQVLLGNSLPIRLADRFAHEAPPDVAVLVQRGVNGIDGLVAGALGAAFRGRPTLAILGDVTTLHDVGSFALARRGAPLVLLVLDNGGGRIFEQLPLGSRPDLAHAMPHFTTEHGVDLAAVARAFGLPASSHDALEGVEGALEEAFARPGTSVVVARTPPHDAQLRERRLRARLAALR